MSTTSNETRAINQIFNDSEGSSFVAKNKAAVIALLLVIILAVIGYGVFSTFNHKSNTEANARIFTYESGPLKTLVTTSNDVNAASAVVAFKDLHKANGNYFGMLPVTLETADALINAKKYTEALEVLEVGLKVADSSYGTFFVLSRMAVAYEDLNQNDKAIEVLQKMTSNKAKVFEGKIYLDLGRLYLKMGDKENARKQLTHVVEKANSDSEFVKLAQIYLSQTK